MGRLPALGRVFWLRRARALAKSVFVDGRVPSNSRMTASPLAASWGTAR